VSISSSVIVRDQLPPLRSSRVPLSRETCASLGGRHDRARPA
jgi:hypothetical protein